MVLVRGQRVADPYDILRQVLPVCIRGNDPYTGTELPERLLDPRLDGSAFSERYIRAVAMGKPSSVTTILVDPDLSRDSKRPMSLSSGS